MDPTAPSGALSAPTFRWIKGEVIGRGSYGKVYLDLNSTTGEMIAVKQIEVPSATEYSSQGLAAMNAFKTECTILRKLDHPNIVQYLGMEQSPEFLSIFMEYVSGGSIGTCVRKQGKLGPLVTKSFTKQIIAGLEYLHSKDIIHRNLRADKVLVDPQGICKLSSFRLSKYDASHNSPASDQPATQMYGPGSIYWLSPEVIDSAEISTKVDIWSLGCVWQEMMTGERPWKDHDMFYVLKKLGRENQSPPLPDGVIYSKMQEYSGKRVSQ